MANYCARSNDGAINHPTDRIPPMPMESAVRVHPTLACGSSAACPVWLGRNPVEPNLVKRLAGCPNRGGEVALVHNTLEDLAPIDLNLLSHWRQSTPKLSDAPRVCLTGSYCLLGCGGCFTGQMERRLSTSSESKRTEGPVTFKASVRSSGVNLASIGI